MFGRGTTAHGLCEGVIEGDGGDAERLRELLGGRGRQVRAHLDDAKAAAGDPTVELVLERGRALGVGVAPGGQPRPGRAHPRRRLHRHRGRAVLTGAQVLADLGDEHEPVLREKAVEIRAVGKRLRLGVAGANAPAKNVTP
jgi:hypothetical protein